MALISGVSGLLVPGIARMGCPALSECFRGLPGRTAFGYPALAECSRGLPVLLSPVVRPLFREFSFAMQGLDCYWRWKPSRLLDSYRRVRDGTRNGGPPGYSSAPDSLPLSRRVFSSVLPEREGGLNEPMSEIPTLDPKNL